jgi:hypothetical protein
MFPAASNRGIQILHDDKSDEIHWRIYDNGNGSYSFENARYKNTYLDLAVCSKSWNVSLKGNHHTSPACAGGASQKWKITKNPLILKWIYNKGDISTIDVTDKTSIEIPTSYMNSGDWNGLALMPDNQSTPSLEKLYSLDSSDQSILSYRSNGGAFYVKGKPGSATLTFTSLFDKIVKKQINVTVLAPTKEEIYAQHQNRSYEWGGGVFSDRLNNIYFRLSIPVASQIKSYSVQIDDGHFHTQLRYSYANNQIKLNLLDYNAGYGVKESHRVIVRAELTNGDSIKVMEEYIRR